MEILRKKSPDHNFFYIFWSWQLWIMYHCILPCKFDHLWSSPSWPTWPCATGRLWSWSTTRFEARWRSCSRLTAFISSFEWRWVPNLHNGFYLEWISQIQSILCYFWEKRENVGFYLYTLYSYGDPSEKYSSYLREKI